MRSTWVFTLLAVCFFVNMAFAEPMVVNGDFETDPESFAAWPGYVNENPGGTNPASIPGWTGPAGGIGINPISSEEFNPNTSPFRDNGGNDTHVAFLQGATFIEQEVSGFVVGNEYVLSLDFNSRNCCGDMPIAMVVLDGNVIANSTDIFPAPGGVVPVGDANPWHHADIDFMAEKESMVLRIESAAAAAGDATLVVDNVSIVPEPSAGLLAMAGCLAILAIRRRR